MLVRIWVRRNLPQIFPVSLSHFPRAVKTDEIAVKSLNSNHTSTAWESCRVGPGPDHRGWRGGKCRISCILQILLNLLPGTDSLSGWVWLCLTLGDSTGGPFLLLGGWFILQIESGAFLQSWSGLNKHLSPYLILKLADQSCLLSYPWSLGDDRR